MIGTRDNGCVNLQLASASGNVFGYFWADEVPVGFDGPAMARALCPRGIALGLDGVFLLDRLGPSPWRLEHWDADGSHTFCSNGSRAAYALAGAPPDHEQAALSAGVAFDLKRVGNAIAIRMPEGAGCGLQPLPIPLTLPAAFGFIGNPQLVLEVASVAAVDLAALAPPLRHHPLIPGGTNVNVVEVVAPGRARIRSWERGVEGETLCCGTGSAVAAAWLAERTGLLEWTLETASGEPVEVTLEWAGPGQWRNLWLAGPVRRLGLLELDPCLL